MGWAFNGDSLARVLRRFRQLLSVFGRGAPAYFGGNACISWSQLGEDALLRPYLSDRLENVAYKGFWVDIGANHPIRFSNTKMFSDCGWTGINVDALPEAISRFNRLRKCDINVNVGIGKRSGNLDYFVFESDLINTFSKDFAEQSIARGEKLLEVRQIPVITLEQLLDQHLPHGQKIDFLSIDAEGLDLEILESNNWEKYAPDFIMIEIHANGHNESVVDGPVARYLAEHNYVFAGQCMVTTLFSLKKSSTDFLKFSTEK